MIITTSILKLVFYRLYDHLKKNGKKFIKFENDMYWVITYPDDQYLNLNKKLNLDDIVVGDLSDDINELKKFIHTKEILTPCHLYWFAEIIKSLNHIQCEESINMDNSKYSIHIEDIKTIFDKLIKYYEDKEIYEFNIKNTQYCEVFKDKRYDLYNKPTLDCIVLKYLVDDYNVLEKLIAKEGAIDSSHFDAFSAIIKSLSW